jgi:hypothetical protein
VQIPLPVPFPLARGSLARELSAFVEAFRRHFVQVVVGAVNFIFDFQLFNCSVVS